MKRAAILVAMVAALMAGTAYALVKTFTWVAPTENTDGSALPPAQITGFNFTCTATGQPTVSFTAVGSARTIPRDLPPGDWACSATASANGQTSAPSNVVNFTVPQPTPRPPVLSVD